MLFASPFAPPPPQLRGLLLPAAALLRASSCVLLIALALSANENEADQELACIQCGPFIETETSVTQFKVASTVAFRALMRIPRGRGCVR